MLSLRLPDEMEKRLDTLAASTNRSKSFYVKQALEQFLEDQEDRLLALSVLEKDNGKRYSLEDLKKLAGLE